MRVAPFLLALALACAFAPAAPAAAACFAPRPDADLARALDLAALDPRGARYVIAADVPAVVTGPHGIELVFIPAGSFVMGSAAPAAEADERPPHRVSIPAGFYMGRFEVTQAQWLAVMGDCHSQFIGLDLPVEKVAWLETAEFLRRLNTHPDAAGAFSLPTEAEWEYACRAGSGTDYWWGDAPAGGVMWNRETAGDRTHPVGTTRPNAFGLFDMAGNVSEWCADVYAGYPGGGLEPATDERPTYVTRGGHWNGRPEDGRSANRSRLWEHYRLAYTGFRVKFVPR